MKNQSLLMRSTTFATTIATVLALAPSLAQAASKADRKPALFEDTAKPYLVLKAPLSGHPELIELFNTFNDSTVYAVSMNEILNGSGTNVQVGTPLKNESFLSQTLRTLSLFDLYFSYRVRNSKSRGDLALSTVPMKQTQADQMAPYEFHILPNLFQGAWNLVTPVTGAFVKAEPSDSAGYKQYVDLAREGVVDSLRERYPIMDTARKDIPMGAADLVLRSFQPLYSSSWLSYGGSESFFKSTLLLSPIGLPDFNSDPKHIKINALDFPHPMETGLIAVDHISYGNFETNDNNVMRIYAMKDYKLQDQFYLNVDFGRLAKSGNNIAGLVEDSNLRRDVRHGDGLMIHGGIHIQSQNPKMELVNQILKNFRIEISIHRLTLDIKRLNGGKSTENALTLIQDIPPFSLKDSVRVNPKSTQVTFRVFTLGNHNRQGVTGMTGFKKGLVTIAQHFAEWEFCTDFKDSDKDADGSCKTTFSSYDRFRTDFPKLISKLMSFLNKIQAPNIVTNQVKEQLASSIDGNFEDFGAQIDDAITVATGQVMQAYKQAQDILSLKTAKTAMQNFSNKP